jgi:hypothetical protein
MKRTLEWLLAGLGAIMCIGGAISIWIPQAADNPPGFSLWPLPVLLIIGVALLGVMGFLGIALEPQKISSRWGFLIWIACGTLLGLSILGEISISVIVLLGAPALTFSGAAILADIRRERKILPDLGILVACIIASFGLFFLITLL